MRSTNNRWFRPEPPPERPKSSAPYSCKRPLTNRGQSEVASGHAGNRATRQSRTARLFLASSEGREYRRFLRSILLGHTSKLAVPESKVVLRAGRPTVRSRLSPALNTMRQRLAQAIRRAWYQTAGVGPSNHPAKLGISAAVDRQSGSISIACVVKAREHVAHR
jgi:hypothetical protein